MSADLPEGMGLWVWRTDLCDPQKVVSEACGMGASHLLVKIADGAQDHCAGGSSYLPNAKQILALAHAAGLKVYAWAFIYGNQPATEGAYQGALAKAFDGFVIDCETSDGSEKYANSSYNAKLYIEGLLRGLGSGIPVGLSSYWKPSSHTDMPWKTLLSGCDFVMPQVYWRCGGVGNLEAMLETCQKEYAAYGLPVLPVGGDLDEGVTAGEIGRFKAACGSASHSWWSYDQSTAAQRVALKEEKMPSPSLSRVAEIAEYVATQGKQSKTITVNGVPFDTKTGGYCLRFVRLALTAALRDVIPNYVFGPLYVADAEWNYFPWFDQYASGSCTKLSAGGDSRELGHYGPIASPSPGDIVGFKPFTAPGHIAIYLGRGRVVENTSSTRGPGTVISPLEGTGLLERAVYYRVFPSGTTVKNDLMLCGLDGNEVKCDLSEDGGTVTGDLQTLITAYGLDLNLTMQLGGYGQDLTSVLTSVDGRAKVRPLLEACGFKVTYRVWGDGRRRIYVAKATTDPIQQ